MNSGLFNLANPKSRQNSLALNCLKLRQASLAELLKSAKALSKFSTQLNNQISPNIITTYKIIENNNTCVLNFPPSIEGFRKHESSARSNNNCFISNSYKFRRAYKKLGPILVMLGGRKHNNCPGGHHGYLTRCHNVCRIYDGSISARTAPEQKPPSHYDSSTHSAAGHAEQIGFCLNSIAKYSA